MKSIMEDRKSIGSSYRGENMSSVNSYILAIDQGTTGTTVLIINQKAEILAKVNQEFRQIFPKSGWVEHDPEDIWHSTRSTIKKSLEIAQISPYEIKAIGITNQRETVISWDAQSHKTFYNAIVWQCRRTADFCQSLRKKQKEKWIKKKTGLLIDPYFSASKINWLFKNVKSVSQAARSGNLRLGTVDTFLLWRLTNGQSFKTDVSNASRTMLMNLKTLNWDKELCAFFKVPWQALPTIHESNHHFGVTQNMGILPDGIPIHGIAGDQQAALFGQLCTKPGEVKCTFGTGSFMLMNTGGQPVESKHRLLTTLAWKLSGHKAVYALEGGAFICGAAVQWLRDGLKIINSSSEMEDLAKSVDHTDGVEFVPALTGLGAPYWQAEARGIITGLNRGTTQAHIARATLEAMALQNAEILICMQKDAKKKVKSMKVDGGAVVNNLLMQLQSDYLQAPVIRPNRIETTALGAAYLAGLGVGIWKSTQEIERVIAIDKIFKPQIKKSVFLKRLSSWHRAVQKTF